MCMFCLLVVALDFLLMELELHHRRHHTQRKWLGVGSTGPRSAPALDDIMVSEPIILKKAGGGGD